MIAGICGGFAQATQTPAWLWRAGFLFLAIGALAGLLLYLILWFFMPDATP